MEGGGGKRTNELKLLLRPPMIFVFSFIRSSVLTDKLERVKSF